MLQRRRLLRRRVLLLRRDSLLGEPASERTQVAQQVPVRAAPLAAELVPGWPRSLPVRVELLGRQPRLELQARRPRVAAELEALERSEHSRPVAASATSERGRSVEDAALRVAAP